MRRSCCLTPMVAPLHDCIINMGQQLCRPGRCFVSTFPGAQVLLLRQISWRCCRVVAPKSRHLGALHSKLFLHRYSYRRLVLVLIPGAQSWCSTLKLRRFHTGMKHRIGSETPRNLAGEHGNFTINFFNLFSEQLLSVIELTSIAGFNSVNDV